MKKSLLVRQKVVPPGLPTAAVSRPRLNQLYASLVEEHRNLAVFAVAGSGKTVQAQLFANEEKWTLAWLTLDGGDRSTSRMLSYLAAALEPHLPTAPALLEAAFEDTSTPDEGAAILAEAIEATRLLLVIDHCEAIADSRPSCSALETFLRYLPPGVRTMLLGRSEMQFSLGRLLLQGRAGRIMGSDLALTLEEASALVAARGDSPADLRERWEAARGWVAAVAFGGPHRPGGHDHVRDFTSYLSCEVVGMLSAEERRFLLDTSVLDAVSQRGAAALCGAGSWEIWRNLGTRHLPATTSDERTIVYHPCLRDFLREQLELEDPARMLQLQLRHVSLLLESSQFEEAVELLLSLGRLDEAAQTAELACSALTDRGDWTTYLRWVDALGEARVRRRPALVGPWIRALRGVRRFAQARELALELDAAGTLTEIVSIDPEVVTQIAWSMQWRPAEALAFLDRHDPDQRAAGVRYMVEVTALDTPPSGTPLVLGKETDRLVSWALMVLGRLDDLVAMLPGPDDWPPRSPLAPPHPLLGLVWQGERRRARELFDEVPPSVKEGICIDLWRFLDVWLLLGEGDAEAAVAAAERSVTLSRLANWGFESVFEIVHGIALLEVDRTDDAVEVLEEALKVSQEAGLKAYAEWAQTVLGRARLKLGQDEVAVGHLRSAVRGMQRADRMLMMPLAGVYLSEAEARLGNTQEADAAAAAAHASAVRMGAGPTLQLALSHFPGVLRRQARGSFPEWRRGSMDSPAAVVRGPRPAERRVDVVIEPFGGNADIFVGGRAVGVRRLKVLELASYLTAHPSGVNRQVAQASLFPESDRHKGSNHFRQVVHHLRKTATLTLQRLPSSTITWSDGISVDATDLQFERALAVARTLDGEERLAGLEAALDLVVGPYLVASDLEWACERRYELDVIQEVAELELACLAAHLKRFDLCRSHTQAVLARNPYSEAASRLLMESELALGSEARALAVYRQSVRARRDIGLPPDEALAGLLHSSA